MKPLYYITVLALAPLCLSAQTVNSWLNPGSANWDNANSWTAGVPPNSSQSASFPDAGGRVITIDSTTAQAYPDSLTVASISMSGGNTLALDNLSTNTPLCAGSISIEAQGSAQAALQQNGSLLVVSNEFYLAGSTYNYPWPGTPASYSIADGAMSAQSLVLDGSYGNCNLTVTNSTAMIDGPLEVRGVTWTPSQLNLLGGTLSCSDAVNTGGSMFIAQTGGALIVSNLFVFDGYYPRPYGSTFQHATYTFSGGTLQASNIQIDAEWNIGSSSQPNRITNPGYLQLSGIIDIGDASEQLGQFILAASTNYQFDTFGDVLTNLARTNAVINFTGSATVLSFADSSAETWSNGVPLLITGWNGSLCGAGKEQLKFGSDATGLTPAQLSQIQFINPKGLPAGTYVAEILNTGEVVPYAPRWLQMTPQPGGIVLTWQPESVLQTSTSVTGPYVDLPDATAPYTNYLGASQRFFHVRPANSSSVARQ